MTLRHSFVDRAPAATASSSPARMARRCSKRPSRPMPATSARARWRSRVDRLALAALALTLVVARAVVVLERQARRQPRARAAATALALALVGLAWLVATFALSRGAAATPARSAGRAVAGRHVPRRLRRDRPRAPGHRVMLLVDPVRRAHPGRDAAAATPTSHGFGDVVVRRGAAGAGRPRPDRPARRRLRARAGSRAAQRGQPAPLQRGAVGDAAPGPARRPGARAGGGRLGRGARLPARAWRAGAVRAARRAG